MDWKAEWRHLRPTPMRMSMALLLFLAAQLLQFGLWKAVLFLSAGNPPSGIAFTEPCLFTAKCSPLRLALLPIDLIGWYLIGAVLLRWRKSQKNKKAR